MEYYFYGMQMQYKSDPIPVKPYVKRFVEAGNVIKPFALDFLHSLFTKKIESDKQVSLDEYTEVLKFPLPEFIFNKYGFLLCSESVVRFNTFLERYIKDRFECELEANLRKAKKEQAKFHIQEMVLDLRKEFGLEEENFPFETIKKSLQRFCKRQNIDLQSIKIYKKSVPKKCVKTLTSSHITQKEFLKVMNMGESTFFRRKENNTLGVVVEKIYGRNYILINSLPSYLIPES